MAVLMIGAAVLAAGQDALARGYARAVASAFAFAEAPATISADNVITFGSSGFAYQVAPECAALTPMLFLAGAIVAHPGLALRRRVSGVAIAISAILTLNFLRLLSLGWIGASAPRHVFDLAHEYVWVVLNFVALIALWLAIVGPPASAGTFVRVLREHSARLLTFAAIVGLILAATLVFDLAASYTRVLTGLATDLRHLVAPDAVPIVARRVWWTEYAMLTGFVACLLSSSRRSWRARALATSTAAILIVLAQVVATLVVRQWFAAGNEAGPALDFAITAYYAVLAFGGWRWWTQKRPSSAPATPTPAPD